MRKHLLGFGLAVTMGAAAAFAAIMPATAASAAPDRGTVGASGVIVPMSWIYWDTYDTKAECRDVGDELIRKGWASNYACNYEGGQYVLRYVPRYP
jgi:hypothetical protein